HDSSYLSYKTSLHLRQANFLMCPDNREARAMLRDNPSFPRSRARPPLSLVSQGDLMPHPPSLRRPGPGLRGYLESIPRKLGHFLDFFRFFNACFLVVGSCPQAGVIWLEGRVLAPVFAGGGQLFVIFP